MVNNYIVRSYREVTNTATKRTSKSCTKIQNITKLYNNRLTMDQFSKVLLANVNVHTVPQRALDCGPGSGF